MYGVAVVVIFFVYGVCKVKTPTIQQNYALATFFDGRLCTQQALSFLLDP
jgi:hypothetical protein